MDPLFAHFDGDYIILYLIIFLIYALAAIVALLLTMVVGFLIFMMGTLLGGPVLVALVKRKRHLFWIFPLVNVGLYFLFYPYITGVAEWLAGSRPDLDLSHPLKPAGLAVTFVPVVGAVVLTTAVVGAVLWYHQHEQPQTARLPGG